MARASLMLSRSLPAVLAAVLLVLAGARAAPATHLALDGITAAIPCDGQPDLIADCDDGSDSRRSVIAEPESPDQGLDAVLGDGWNEAPCPASVWALAGAAELRTVSTRLRAHPARGPPHRAG